MPGQHVIEGLTMADIYLPEHVDDPYPLYRSIREVSPVFWDQRMGEAGAWMVTGYDAVATVLQGKQFSARRVWDPDGRHGDLPATLTALHAQLMAIDPPDHTRLRHIVKGPFVPAAVARLRDEIAATADELLDAVLPNGEMDFFDDFALTLPAAILGRIFGVPLADRDEVWRRILNWGLVVDAGPVARENSEYLMRGVGKYLDYFRGLVAARRDRRTDDLIQVLADGWAEGAIESEEELIGNLMFMMTAGQATTAHQISNTALALLAHPDVFARMWADPAQVVAATPEFMRYDCSVQQTRRRATATVELAGHRIEAGDELFVWMGAANRDPAMFPDPDRLDPDRPRVHNMALGHGPHYCVGGQLGQLVNEVAIGLFAERVRNPRIDLDKVVRASTATFRGALAMPMTFDAEGRDV